MDSERELERLREAMEQAKALYEGAKVEYQRAIERRDDLGSTHPDGSIRHAVRAQTYARRSYREALTQYNRFVLDRKPPPIIG